MKTTIEPAGSWEENQERKDSLRDRSIGMTAGDAEKNDPARRRSTGADLLRSAQGWAGEDFEECLQAVYESRSRF